MKIDKLHRITKILSVEPFKLTLLWDNAEARVVDFEPLFEEWRKDNEPFMFPLFEWDVFRKAKVPSYNALQWPNVPCTITVNGKTETSPLDLDAQVLYTQSKPVSHPPFVAVGNMIRRARETAGLSQTDVAARIGTTRNHLSRIENGRSNIQLDTLQKIVAVGMGKELVLDIR